MIKTTDQLNRTLFLPETPTRIISLVPSQTELLFDLGLNDEIIGITKFCIHPEVWFHSKTRIGGTKSLDIDKIKKLKPDLIIANKEENTEEQIKELMNEFPIWISDINNLDDALKMINEISKIAGKEIKGKSIIDNIKSNFVSQHSLNKISCAYFIWKNPLLTIGGDTFISDMLNYAGFENVFDSKKRYPEISFDELKVLQPELIFLSSEPYPFKDRDLLEFEAAIPGTKVFLVDGEMFSWYGSRLLMSPGYFKKLKAKINSAL